MHTYIPWKRDSSFIHPFTVTAKVEGGGSRCVPILASLRSCICIPHLHEVEMALLGGGSWRTKQFTFAKGSFDEAQRDLVDVGWISAIAIVMCVWYESLGIPQTPTYVACMAWNKVECGKEIATPPKKNRLRNLEGPGWIYLIACISSCRITNTREDDRKQSAMTIRSRCFRTAVIMRDVKTKISMCLVIILPYSLFP